MDIGECFVCDRSSSIRHCAECQIDCCEECYECHSKSCYDLKSLQYHICEEHKVQVKRYCLDCANLLCEICLRKGHTGHTISLLTNAFENLKGYAETIFKDLKQRKEEVQKIIDLIDPIRTEDEEGKSEGIPATMVQEKKTIKEYSKPLLDILQNINLHVKYLETKDHFMIVFLWKWIELKKWITIYDTQERLCKANISKYSQHVEVQLQNVLQPILNRGCLSSLTTDQEGSMQHHGSFSAVPAHEKQFKMLATTDVLKKSSNAQYSSSDNPLVHGTTNENTHGCSSHVVDVIGVHSDTSSQNSAGNVNDKTKDNKKGNATNGCHPGGNAKQQINRPQRKLKSTQDHSTGGYDPTAVNASLEIDYLQNKMTPVVDDNADDFVMVPDYHQSNTYTETNQTNLWMEEEGSGYKDSRDSQDSVSEITQMMCSFEIAENIDVNMSGREGSRNALNKSNVTVYDCDTRVCNNCTMLINDLQVKEQESQTLKDHFTYIFQLCYIMVEEMNKNDGGYVTFTRTNQRDFDILVEQLEMISNNYIKIKNELVIVRKALNDKIVHFANWTTEQLNSEIENDNALRKEIHHMKAKINQLRRENHEILRKHQEPMEYRTYTNKLQKDLAELQSFKHRIIEENELLKRQVHTERSKNETELQAFAQENGDLVVRVDELQRFKHDKSKENESLKSQLQKLQTELSTNKTELQVLTIEKGDLLVRSASLPGNQSIEENANPPDLCDPNRPTKIGDTFLKLFENEWVEVLKETKSFKSLFPHLEPARINTIEEIVIRHLYKLVSACYKECFLISEEHVDNIKKAVNDMLIPLGDNEQSSRKLASLSGLKDVIALRRQNAKRFADHLYEKKVLIKRINNLADWTYGNKNEQLLKLLMETPFFDKCVHLCWYMVIQDPVMYLDDELECDTTYDKKLYEEYTCSGDNVRFVVWPALFLHKDGPLICKGNVQACDFI